jgi:SAM-dependent methyltransferase
MDTEDRADPAEYDYRRWVGPVENYDVVGGLQFGILFALGLRDDHRVADIGCGSLRGGRLLIPYLRPERYFGLEPFERFVREGIDAELGAQILEVKRPRFVHRTDFRLDEFGETFDFALAQSIYSHTHPELLVEALGRVRDVLAPKGLLVGTYVPATETKFNNVVAPIAGGGWAYPHAVRYEWSEFARHLGAAGLGGTPVSWYHPHQTWFVAGHVAGKAWEGADRRLRRSLFEPPRAELLMRRARKLASRAVRRVHKR